MIHSLPSIRWGALCFLTTASLSAATIVVDLGGGGYFREIQPALDAASHGDLILVRPGEYVIRAPLDFNRLREPASDQAPKDLELESAGGPAVTTIRMAEAPDDPDRGSVFVFQSGETPWSTVKGFTLTGGRGTKVLEGMRPFAGGAVLSTQGSAPTLSVCTISGNFTPDGDGAAVACIGAGIRVLECKVVDNETSGLYCRDAEPIDLVACELSGNAGWGVYADHAGGRVMSCRIARNLRAGIFANRSALLIDGCELSENAGAGLSLEGDQGTAIQGCQVFYNVSRGLDLSVSSPLVQRCLVAGNLDYHGGGIHCRDGSDPMILNTEIAGNWAYDGGGVWVSGSAPTLVNCLIYANVAQEGPGFYASSGLGARLVNCTIYGNEARPFPGEGADSEAGTGAEAGVGAGCGGTETAFLNCLFWDNEPEEACGTLTTCLVGQDPLFEEPGVFDLARTRTLDLGGTSYVLPDYVGEPPILRLKEGSPAKDVGTLEGTVAYDFEYRLRPAGEAPDAGAYELGASPAVAFLRGDSDSDSVLGISDPIRSLGYLFLGGSAPSCLKTADSSDDGVIDISDAVLTLNYLFLGGPPPAPPIEGCGLDPTADRLGCDGYEPCV